MKTYSTAPAIVAGLTGVAVTLLVTFAQPAQAADWRSGVRNNDTTNPFASWRGTSLGVVSGWIDWKKGWSGMYSYASGTQPRALRAKSSNVSFGHGLFPEGGSLAACAKGDYDDEQREVARRLAANGAGDAEIRLGWEASGDWFPWSAAGKPRRAVEDLLHPRRQGDEGGRAQAADRLVHGQEGPGRRPHDLPGRRADHQHRRQPLR